MAPPIMATTNNNNNTNNVRAVAGQQPRRITRGYNNNNAQFSGNGGNTRLYGSTTPQVRWRKRTKCFVLMIVVLSTCLIYVYSDFVGFDRIEGSSLRNSASGTSITTYLNTVAKTANEKLSRQLEIARHAFEEQEDDNKEDEVNDALHLRAHDEDDLIEPRSKEMVLDAVRLKEGTSVASDELPHPQVTNEIEDNTLLKIEKEVENIPETDHAEISPRELPQEDEEEPDPGMVAVESPKTKVDSDVVDDDHYSSPSVNDENARADDVIEETDAQAATPVREAFTGEDGQKHEAVALPDITKEQLEERGVGSVLYVYRVLAPVVAVRTKPSPIGALQHNAGGGTTLGLTKYSVRRGDLVVGYKLVKQHGLWLKLGPFSYAPVTKKESMMDHSFVPMMKQIRRISVPSNLRKYWSMPREQCASSSTMSSVTEVDEEEHTPDACRDRMMVREGVLRILRSSKLMEPEMDPDYDLNSEGNKRRDQQHPSPSSPLNTPVKNVRGRSIVIKKDEENDNDGLSQKLNADDTRSLDDDNEEDDVEEEEEDEDEDDAWGTVSSEQGVNASHVAICRSLLTWAHCNKYPGCGWRKFPHRQYCDGDGLDRAISNDELPEEMRQNPMYDFPLRTSSDGRRPKYFLYQPSGGWNNQRLLFESALIVCKLLNRTCIAPPAAPHSNYFQQYNNIHPNSLVGMPRVLDFDEIAKVVSVVAIPSGQSFPEFVNKKIEQNPNLVIREVIRDHTKYKNGAMKRWSERDIVRLFGNDEADVLYFVNQTLWMGVEWRGQIAGWRERKQMHLAIMPPNHMKRVAIRIADMIGPYQAVHVRRGDKVNQNNFGKISHTPAWYASRIAHAIAQPKALSRSPKVYIATDESNRTYFDLFRDEYQLKTIFCEELPGYHKVLKPYLYKFPRRMFMDVLGMIEQLLCTYAVYFLGSGYSTFSVHILRLRKYRNILTGDYSVKRLGSDVADDGEYHGYLPPAIRDLTSTCDPANAAVHSKPC